MQPVVANLEKQCAGDVTFIHADVDQQKYRQLASTYGVSAIPRFVLLDPSGNIVRQWVGTTSPGDLEQALAEACEFQ